MKQREIELFDGLSPLLKRAHLHLSREGLLLRLEDGGELFWPKSEIRWDQLATIIQVWHTPSEAHFEINESELLTDAEHLGLVQSQFHPRRDIWHWTLGFAVACGLMIGGFYRYLPAVSFSLARQVDRNTERRIFGPLTKPLITDKKVCKNPNAMAALQKISHVLGRALTPGIEPQFVIVDWEMVNAFALPGDYIIFTGKLLKGAESWDEVAGVMAHELQHIEKRHNLGGLIRNSASSFFWALLFGDSSSVMLFDPSTIRSLSQLSYSRDIEAEADQAAVAMLNQVRIDPRGLKKFLAGLEIPESKGWLSWFTFLSSHPDTYKRMQGIEVLRDNGQDWQRNLLSEAEWASLKSACSLPE